MCFKYRLFSIFLCFSISIHVTFAQGKTIDRCNTDVIMQSIYENEPGYFQSIQEGFKSFAAQKSTSKNSIVIIPVHVIIVHPAGQAIGTGDNLSLEHIESQISVINEDFRRTNADAMNMPPEFPGDDSEIEFCLASTDPNGNATDGVTRYVFSGNFDNNEFMIKNATKWPREDYLNIWVAGNIGGLLGYAYIPSTTNLPNPTLDGVVCWTPAFGGPGYATDAVYNLGRTVTHEVGHYLGLNHVWGGGNGGCGQDDGIADTPTQDDKYFGCPNHPSPTCGSNDMFMNYMDYTDDACMNSYTTLQGNYMQLILNTSRSSLLNSANTNCTLGPPLSGIIVDQSDLDCNGDFSGWIEVEAAGGTGPYTYSLNNGTPQSTGLFTGLAAGMYDIEIQDSAGNLFSISTELSEPLPLVLSNDVTEAVSCFGGNDGFIIVSAAGGTESYLYKIGSGDYQSSGYFPNLESGNYIVYVQDANLCIKLLVIQISEPDPLIVYIAEQEDADCYDSSTGSVIIDGIGGNGSYLYSFDGSPFGNETEFTGLEAGNYPVSILDSKNCSHSIIVNIDEPDELVGSVSQLINPGCGDSSDGSVTLLGEGGIEPYNYSLDNMSYQSSNEFTNLTSGIFTFYIKDAHDCIFSFEVALVGEGDVEQSISQLSEILCFGDSTASFEVNASGGNPSYLYSLDGTNYQIDSIFSDLTAGNYTVFVQDQNGCESMQEIILDSPQAFAIENISITNEDCEAENGSITLSISGGTGDIDYSIDGSNYTEDGFFEALANGIYSVFAKDENDCIWMQLIEIEEQSLIDLNIIQKGDVLCFGEENGFVECIAQNGVGTVNYSNDNVNFQSSGTFENLNAGNYTVYTIDEAGCEDQISFVIDQNSTIELVESNLTGADCGLENGSANFVIEGGLSPYLYSLNGIDYVANASFVGLDAGIHVLYVEDANNCNYSLNFEIEQLSSLAILTVIKQDPLCFGDENGSIMINASGGSGELQYSIDGNNFIESNLFSQLGEGAYILSVLDESGCLDEQLVNLVSPDSMSINIQNELHYDCDGNLFGTYNFALSGGTAPYSVFLDENAVESPIPASFFTSSGQFELLVKDNHDCALSPVEIEILEFAMLQGIIEDIKPDDGTGNGSVQLNAKGGTAPYEFSQDGSNFSSEALFSNLEEGIYSFFVMDNNGCIDEIEVTIFDTGIEEVEYLNFKIYPNPFKDEFIVETLGELDVSTLKLELYSINGDFIRIPIIFDTDKYIINGMSFLDSGIYIIKIRDNKHQYYKRIVKI